MGVPASRIYKGKTKQKIFKISDFVERLYKKEKTPNPI